MCAGLLAGTTHVLVSIPPDLEGDVVLRPSSRRPRGPPGSCLGRLPVDRRRVWRLARAHWVDETSTARPMSERSLRRLQAERAWLEFRDGHRQARRDLPAVRHLWARPQRHRQPQGRHGAAHRQAGPGVQPHPCRRHRAGAWRRRSTRMPDIASTMSATTSRRRRRTWWPMPRSCWACPLPPEARLRGRRACTGMAASFWAESKRVKNERIRRGFGRRSAVPDLSGRSAGAGLIFLPDLRAAFPLFAANFKQIAPPTVWTCAYCEHPDRQRTTSRTDRVSGSRLGGTTMFGGAVVHRAVVLIAAVLLFGAPARAKSQTGIAAEDLAREATEAQRLTMRAQFGAEPDWRVTVLMIMAPGTYGIRRGASVADPVLCTTDGCYVSNGADIPARFMPRRRALGVGNTFGARAGACRQSLRGLRISRRSV